MKGMLGALRAFKDDRSGATAIEYALIAGGIAMVIIPTVFTLGETVFVQLYDEIRVGLTGG